MNTYEKTAFRGGWIRGMKDIQDEKHNGDSMLCDHTQYYYIGYCAALTHFNGVVDEHVRYAEKIGLIDVYEDFYGQIPFRHPNP